MPKKGKFDQPLYVSSVEGAVVPRYGTAITGKKNTTIGVIWDPKVQGLVWNTEAVTLIPASEYRRHVKEYDRALKEGSLKRRSGPAPEAPADPPPQGGSQTAGGSSPPKSRRGKRAMETDS